MTLGNISTKYGTNGDDSLTGGASQAVLGLSGNDRLTAAGGNLADAISILAGGVGDDTYVIPAGNLAMILESGGTDTVIFPFSGSSPTGVIYTIDNRHLLIGDTDTNSFGIIIDWKNPANRVDKIVDSTGFTVTYEQVANEYTSSPLYQGNINLQQTTPGVLGYLNPGTGLTPTTFNSLLNNISALAVGNNVSTTPVAEFKTNPAKYMGSIRDYDGNDLGGSSSWKLIGDVDIQGDGDLESILVNPAIERFASVGSVNGAIDFTQHGFGGDTRVVGIYIDPTLQNNPEKIGGPFDSQRRFQNDLKIDNLQVLGAADYNNDGFQDLYFKLGDGTAVLRALMFADGNIQYANYQSKNDLADFMTANNVSSSVWGSWI
jgi:hypothetical protein